MADLKKPNKAAIRKNVSNDSSANDVGLKVINLLGDCLSQREKDLLVADNKAGEFGLNFKSNIMNNQQPADEVEGDDANEVEGDVSNEVHEDNSNEVNEDVSRKDEHK